MIVQRFQGSSPRMRQRSLRRLTHTVWISNFRTEWWGHFLDYKRVCVCPMQICQVRMTRPARSASGGCGSRTWNASHWRTTDTASGVNTTGVTPQVHPAGQHPSESTVPPFTTLPPPSRTAVSDSRPVDLTRRPRMNGLRTCDDLCVHSDRDLVHGIPFSIGTHVANQDANVFVLKSEAHIVASNA